jgi:hypothetical protein
MGIAVIVKANDLLALCSKPATAKQCSLFLLLRKEQKRNIPL